MLQRGLGALAGTRELLTPRTLALSIARRFDEPTVAGFSRRLLGMRTLGLAPVLNRPSAVMDPTTRAWFDVEGRTEASPPASAEDRARALALLQIADLGVDDVLFEDDEYVGVDKDGVRGVRKRRRMRLLHRTARGAVPLDFEAESHGTRTWFSLIGPLLAVLRDGGILLFDELDASLHPTLSAELIRLLQDPATNPGGAQLVFTSHDTSLLNHLNRDEVWLTEKGDDGVTRLGALAEFAGEAVRRSVNIERAYLHGRFGALPEVDRTDLLRALGLIG